MIASLLAPGPFSPNLFFREGLLHPLNQTRCPVIPVTNFRSTPPTPPPPGIPPPEFPDFEKGIREFVKALIKKMGLSLASEREGQSP